MRTKFLAMLFFVLPVAFIVGCSSSHQHTVKPHSTATVSVAPVTKTVAPAPSTSQVVKPVESVLGKYHQINVGITGYYMTGSITKNHVHIILTAQGQTDVLWDGTFVTTHNADSTFNVKSTPNNKVMSASSFGGQASSVKFHYSKGVLSYPFWTLEDKSDQVTIHLAK